MQSFVFPLLLIQFLLLLQVLKEEKLNLRAQESQVLDYQFPFGTWHLKLNTTKKHWFHFLY